MTKPNNPDYPYDDLGPLYQPLAFPVNSTELDAGIVKIVRILRHEGVQTYESCEGGEGHAYALPTVCFTGGKSEGLRVLDIALRWSYPVLQLNRVWQVQDGEVTGPIWQLVLRHKEHESGRFVENETIR